MHAGAVEQVHKVESKCTRHRCALAASMRSAGRGVSNTVLPCVCAFILLATSAVCTSEAPALDTCAGAVAFVDDLKGTVCHKDGDSYTPASCGNSSACKELISSINDTVLSKIDTGFQACANVTGYEGYAAYAGYLDYARLLSISDGCGFPAGTVTLSPPGLDTCAGARAVLGDVDGTVCHKDGDSYTSASCGSSTTCKELISSIDDNALAQIDTGFQACANVTGYEGYAAYAGVFNYSVLLSISNGCGFPADTVKVSHPTGTSLAVPSWVPDCACHHAIWREFWDPAHACPTWVRMTLTLAVHKDDGFDEPGLIDAVARAAGVQQSARVKVGQARISATLTGHTDVDISVRVPHSQDLTNASASIRDALFATEVEQTIGDAVGASVDVSAGPIIDEALTRSSFPGLQCSPGLQCGEEGCPKCVCDCSC